MCVNNKDALCECVCVRPQLWCQARLMQPPQLLNMSHILNSFNKVNSKDSNLKLQEGASCCHGNNRFGIRSKTAAYCHHFPYGLEGCCTVSRHLVNINLLLIETKKALNDLNLNTSSTRQGWVLFKFPWRSAQGKRKLVCWHCELVPDSLGFSSSCLVHLFASFFFYVVRLELGL